MFLVPTIKVDSATGETVISEVKVYEKRAHYAEVDFKNNSIKPIINKNDLPESEEIKRIIFQLTHFRFNIDKNRWVDIEVYVHEKFKSEFKGDTRAQAIEYFIKDLAPWFFSYGERVELPKIGSR